MDWDVFICHAGEDKKFVGKLAEKLSRFGIRVWYDEFMLQAGDSLLRTIDEGLRRSTYGIVVVSPNFFAKEWPQRELDGLMARADHGGKVILPIWHKMTYEEVKQRSLILAGIFAIKSERGMKHVVAELLKVIR